VKSIAATFLTECMKLRRSKIFLITILIFIFIPLMMGLMVFIARHPEITSKMGLAGTKATLFGMDDWTGFFELLNQSVAIMGLIGFSFVTSWVFGSEYTEHTIKDILALPVSRDSIVISKFLIVVIWCSLLSLLLFAIGIITGRYINISGWSEQIFYQQTYKFFMTSFLTLFLCSPVAFFAGYGRGLIAPIGFAIFSLIMAQFATAIGFGPYFPWSIPGVYTAPVGTEGMQLVFGSYVILVLTSVSGFIGTIAWWRFADQH
jgi:ABC-2 type transport system permease protein